MVNSAIYHTDTTQHANFHRPSQTTNTAAGECFKSHGY